MPAATAAPTTGRLGTVLAYAVLLVLTALVTVYGAFFTLLSVGGAPVPVGLALALLTGPLCFAGGRITGSRYGVAAPGLLWALLVLPLISQRREGDLIVDGSLRGLAFLALGALSASVAIGLWRARPASPAGSGSRHTGHASSDTTDRVDQRGRPGPPAG